MSEDFKVGDRVEVSCERGWGVGVITGAASWRVLFPNGRTDIAAPHHLLPAPPEPPSLLDAVDALLASVQFMSPPSEATRRHLSDLAAAAEREKAKP